MEETKHHKRILIVILIIFVAIILLFSLYKLQKTRLLDKSEYRTMCQSIEDASLDFSCQKDMYKYIVNWADENKLNYTVDSSYNIIFDQEATASKSKVAPTVVVVNYNYENVEDNEKSLASAALVAKTELKSGKKTVIFVNNKFNDGSSYERLSAEYIPDNAKVIFLDQGKSAYVSANSFSNVDQTISIPTEREPVTCDSAIRIHIEGLTSDCIDAGINKQISPISLFSTVLTRLKSKSTICQLADFKIGNKGKMYPDSLDATIMMNSYQVDSFTGYLDKRIKAFDKSKKDDFPDAIYSYEVVENTSDYPTEAYTKETFDSLTTVLYALKNGLYRYDEDYDGEILDGFEENDIYAIQCVNQIRVEEEGIFVDVSMQANSKDSMNELLNDNAAISELSKCTIKTTNSIKSFDNSNSRLVSTLRSTYFKVSDLSGTNIVLESDMDTYFTAMSYLSRINNNADIVHVKENSKNAAVITNMLLCYIQTKGNFLSL